ncbi:MULTISPECIES: hypothetical protein [Pyrobaculum]|uniref:PaREP1 domain containing protein n=1 Tax=Pyrobaculum arsenaticum TaxID=121277 RepID=A0A7L4PCJ0_9CREN|nr:hypothetical protein [Pyrobaculum arsenaticum]MCY0889467.1 hypothetical protein [Pyrobaculum arsenaticum]NYR16324.1 hypothetical protein [Pyrobaculum arsenaticum]
MRELPRHRIREVLQSEDYKTLALLCLDLLGAKDWLEGWKKMEEVVTASREFVLSKFLASAYVLAHEEIYRLLSRSTREFLARDVVLCLEKTAQVIDALSQKQGSASGYAPPGA